MTYAAREASVYEGNPIELYQFERDDNMTWRFTSSDSDKTYLGNVFLATPIKRNNIEVSQDVERSTLKIEMSSTEDFIQQFVSEPTFLRINVTLWRYHLDDSQVVSLWTGRVINVEQKESTAIVVCESSQSSLRRPTLRRLYSATCPHLLYGPVCGVDKTLYEINAIISGIDGLDITSTSYGAFSDGYFLGGYAEYTKNATFLRRFITNHVGDVITLNLPLYTAGIGDTLVTYPGCDHSLATCNNTFSNVLNYGGQPWIPVKNPLGGATIF